MKVFIKTLQQTQFPIELEANATVLSLKTQISLVQNVPEERQKLIFSAQVLANDRTLESYSVKDNDFVVLMVTKATTSSAQTPPRVIAPSASNVSNAPSVAQSTTASAPASAPAVSTHTPSEIATSGAEYDAALQRLVDMGFDRQDAAAALKKSFNNAERAVEYLAANDLESADESQAEEVDTSSLDFLRNDPQFQQIRAAVQQNPQLLQSLIQQIGQTNPQLLELIAQNQDAFFALLNENAVTMTREEADAVDRLMALGFEKAKALEAFLLCDKNEALAANFLFDRMNDPDF